MIDPKDLDKVTPEQWELVRAELDRIDVLYQGDLHLDPTPPPAEDAPSVEVEGEEL